MLRKIKLEVALELHEARAIMEFLKRSGHADYRANCVDSAEAYSALHAGEAIREALKRKGF